MVYLRTIRLDLARSLLCSNDVAITVAKVAERCGIPHHGRFAGWYYERYCELPSQTIDRARRLALAKMVTTPAKD